MDKNYATRMGFTPIYEHAIQSLAQMRVPKFDQFEREQVWNAFCYLVSGEVGSTGIRNESNLEWLCAEVGRQSGQSVTMTRASFYTGIKGDNAQFELAGSGEVKKISLGAYVPPFSFEN